MTRVPVAVVLWLHGLIHLLGVLSFWKLANLADLPYTTALLDGRLNVGAAGVWLFGLGWLLATAGFLAAGVGLLRRRPWWRSLTRAMALLSLLLCVLAWPEARAGVLLNIIILAALLLDAPFTRSAGHGSMERVS